ncbi:SixA phosphatase family protein [Aestuariivita boseongensis]|uniref:SixA phosphatase family protein n=1 Tax=Aestuariivita boseongensis TaxID=1470562 RepID=UPI00068374AF|nr:histidine phosphatase family protein [Aestuariivita boseongensis]
MLTLILMRHAKSSWDDPFLTDFERPLNKRGQRSAHALGDWLRAQDLVPDEVISSSSTRTGETFEGLGIDTPVRYTKALYHAGPGEMWQVLATATGKRVLMIGHNPGIAAFAEQIVQNPPEHARFWDYPTGAATVMEFDAENWGEVTLGSGRVTQFVIPRELLE